MIGPSICGALIHVVHLTIVDATRLGKMKMSYVMLVAIINVTDKASPIL